MTLHLTYRYLGCTAMHELNKATTLAEKDHDIYNLPEALEERLELMFIYVIRRLPTKIVVFFRLVNWFASYIRLKDPGWLC